MEKNINKNKKTKITYVCIALLIYLLTTMLTAQIKVISKSDEVIEQKRLEDLQTDYIALQTEYENLKKYSTEQQAVVDEYKTNASSNSELIANLNAQNENNAILAGMKDVQGEGVTVVVNDSKKNVADGYEASSLVVHDSDLSAIINELKAAGAEAISVNGNRIIATTSVRCVGPVILVNDVKIATPFTIKAIGDAQYLESAIKLKGGVADTLKSTYGIEIEVQREKNIVINKFSETIKFDYAKLYEGKGE